MLRKCEEGADLEIKFGDSTKRALAFYKGLVFAVTQNTKHDDSVDGYRITHIPTGLAIGNKISNRESAKTLAGMLEDIYHDSATFRAEDPKILKAEEVKDLTKVARAVAKVIGSGLSGSHSAQELAEKISAQLTSL